MADQIQDMHEEYVAPEKPLGEFTDQEREEFVAELRRRYTEEQMEALEAFGYVAKMASNGWRVYREHLEEVMATMDQARSLIRSIAETVANDPALADMNVNDLSSSCCSCSCCCSWACCS